MAEHSRIDDLRRRVQKDPASIAFAQLAEECRRSGNHQEAIDTCRAGLAIHPEYLSARVTLGRALIGLGEVDEAHRELARVLETAPENLAAIRGLAEIYHRRGDLAEALVQYRAALLLARNDPDLEETIADLSRQIEPAVPETAGSLTMRHMQDELLQVAPSPRAMPPQVAPPPQSLQSQSNATSAMSAECAVDVPPERAAPGVPGPQTAICSASSTVDVCRRNDEDGTLTATADDRVLRTVAALEQWLAAIHAPREERHL